jgi:outer membrane protein W
MFRARSIVLVLALAAVAVFASAPAMAQEHKFRVFVTADWVSPNGSDDITVGSVTDAVQGSDDFGYEAGFEWRMNKIVGLEGSYLIGSNTFELKDLNTDLGTLDQQAVTAALNFHILPTKFFDLWIAPVASWYNYDDFEIDSSLGGGEASLDSQWGYGAQVGLDIGLGKLIAITGGVRYIKIDVKSDDLNDSVAFDPIIARVGLAFRFGTR